MKRIISLTCGNCAVVLAVFAISPVGLIVACRLESVLTTPSTSTIDPRGRSCNHGLSCPFGRRCAVDDNQRAACVCEETCSDYYSPVCGSDNRTYWSACGLIREACRTNKNLTVIYKGQCRNYRSACDGVTCPSNRECAIAKNRVACVCIHKCPTYYSPVCGSDHRTHFTECDLGKRSCLTNDNITLVHRGECKVATCDAVTCPLGRRCAVDEKGHPVCVCVDECSEAVEVICATNGKMYGNECELQKESCLTGRSIGVAHRGFCFKGSVCNGHQCPQDMLCTVEQNNNRPVCVCNESCSHDYDPVCGTDGITYHSLCFLKREACKKRTNLAVARAGLCQYREHCNGVVCPPRMRCTVDVNNLTSCVCPDHCGNYYDPICGSDNQTHNSHCEMMLIAACKTNTSITVRHQGFCSEGPNCQGIVCPIGKHCDSQHQPEPKCVCDTVCPKTYNLICGTNNKTYNNSCELLRDSCLTNTSIGHRYYGRKCDEGPGCIDTRCPSSHKCIVDERNQPMCVCSQSCNFESREVCGTDNETYINGCFLEVAACLTNKSTTVQYLGRCKGDGPCRGFVCSSDRRCSIGDEGRPICVCKEQCDCLGCSTVCGSDSRTYDNYCELRKQACLTNSSIQGLHYGKCVEASVCDGISCAPDRRCAVDEWNQPTCVCIEECYSVWYPVCGSDGQTYGNECELQKAACMLNTNVTLAYRGPCDQGRTCRNIYCRPGRICVLNEENQPTCVCSTDRHSTYHYPVCGTDGKTYDNEYHLKMEACVTDSNTEVNYHSPCKNDLYL